MQLLNAKRKELESDMADRSKTIQQNNTEIKSMNMFLENLQDHIQKLKDSEKGLEGELKQTQSDFQAFRVAQDAVVKDLKRWLQEARSKGTELERNSREQAQLLEIKSSAVDNLTLTVQGFEKQMGEMKAQKEILRTELEATRSDLDSQTTALTLSQADLHDFRYKYQTAEE